MHIEAAPKLFNLMFLRCFSLDYTLLERSLSLLCTPKEQIEHPVKSCRKLPGRERGAVSLGERKWYRKSGRFDALLCPWSRKETKQPGQATSRRISSHLVFTVFHAAITGTRWSEEKRSPYRSKMVLEMRKRGVVVEVGTMRCCLSIAPTFLARDRPIFPAGQNIPVNRARGPFFAPQLLPDFIFRPEKSRWVSYPVLDRLKTSYFLKLLLLFYNLFLFLIS
jgi:hypothetical protein